MCRLRCAFRKRTLPDFVRSAGPLFAVATLGLGGRTVISVRSPIILLLATCLGFAGAHAATGPPLTLEEVISAAGFDDQQRSDLLAGKIVTKDFDEGSDKEMSILVALKVSLSLPEVLEAWRELVLLDFDEDLIAVGRIGADQDVSEALAEVEFTAEEGDEIRGLLGAEPGSDFNLSQVEIARFATLARRFSSRGCERDAACRSAVNETYRSVLAERLAAYRKGGLEAVSIYARSRGKVADPGEELHLAAEKLPLARRRVPEVYRAWLEYPRSQPEGSEHQFLWLKRDVEGRATFILSHRAIYETDDAFISVERHFYVGRFYNSLQMLSFIAAQGSEVIGILLNRTSTDQVAGFGTSAKKLIGRSKVRKGLVGTFESLLADLK